MDDETGSFGAHGLGRQHHPFDRALPAFEF
jgi:hypothetical protein